MESKKSYVLIYIMLAVASLAILLPMSWMLVTSFKSVEHTFSSPEMFFPRPIVYEAYMKIWSRYNILTYFKNSLIVVLSSTFISMFFSCLAGYGISRFKFAGRGSFLTFLLITQMFPNVMMLIPFYRMMMKFDLIDTRLGLILPYIAFTVPFCTWMMLGYFDTLPRELDESGMVDGCNRLQTFWKIILPLAVPGMAATAIYSFINGWNEFMFATTLTSSDAMKTITFGIASLVTEDKIYWNDMMAIAVMAGIPVTIIFLCLQKYLIKNLAAGGVKA